MRILLDEDLPRRLGVLLVGHEASTVQRSGWSGIKNGRLLTLGATKFDVFLTMDGGLEFQQNLSTLPIARGFGKGSGLLARARCTGRLRARRIA